ncbi:MAG TPA: hypothetical protein VN662_04250 [Rhodanobacteraceae bacterium]|nr:hypothetical protein [Rhodanobacteraceae bacterium]
MLEFMAEGIRQFLTATERLPGQSAYWDGKRDLVAQQQYFILFEQLRFHLHSCLQQLSILADLSTPKVEAFLRSESEWELANYQQPKLDVRRP